MPAKLFLSGPCEICGQKTDGRHFGVLSCRACAAFFRRSVFSMKCQRRCTRNNCSIYSNARFPCKSCRLKRCLDVGMDPKKFQLDRDPICCSSQSSDAVSQSLSNFVGRPEFILCCEPDKSSKIRNLVDVSNLIFKAEKLLEQDSSGIPYHSNFNTLERLAQTMENIRQRKFCEKVRKFKVLGKSESLFIWEQQFLKTVEWFSNFPEFKELDNSVKMEIVIFTWVSWSRLDKFSETAKLLRKQNIAYEKRENCETSCVNLTSFKIDLTWLTNYSLEQLEFFMTCHSERYCQQCIEDLIKLNPTEIELNFMLVQLSLQQALRIMKCPKILEKIEKMMEKQADSLHEYYQNTLKNPYYSGRLAKLMKINRWIEADLRHRREKNHIAKMFNILSVEFSHPEVFELN